MTVAASDGLKLGVSASHRATLADALRARNAARNEVLWNFLAAEVAARTATGLQTLFGQAGASAAIWLETRPASPREGEGATCVDLAAGSIRVCDEDDHGIELDAGVPSPWAGFVEAKLLSDISSRVTHDPARNQLARVIENLLTLQGDGRFAQRLRFTLLTPRYFRDPSRTESRLYGYKFAAYKSTKARLLADLRSSCLPATNVPSRRYPSLEERLECLELHWVTYEDVFALDPTLSSIDVMMCAMAGKLPEVVRTRIAAALAR